MTKLASNIIMLVLLCFCSVSTASAYSVAFVYNTGSGGWDVNLNDFITPTDAYDVSHILKAYDLDITYNSAFYTYASTTFTDKLGSPPSGVINLINVDTPGLIDLYQQSLFSSPGALADPPLPLSSPELYALQQNVNTSYTLTLATLFFTGGGVPDLNLQFTNWYLPDGGPGRMNFNDIKAFNNTVIYDGPTPVPEPGTMMLFFTGIAGMLVMRRRLSHAVRTLRRDSVT